MNEPIITPKREKLSTFLSKIYLATILNNILTAKTTSNKEKVENMKYNGWLRCIKCNNHLDWGHGKRCPICGHSKGIVVEKKISIRLLERTVDLNHGKDIQNVYYGNLTEEQLVDICAILKIDKSNFY